MEEECKKCKHNDTVNSGCNHELWNHCIVRVAGNITEYIYYEPIELKEK